MKKEEESKDLKMSHQELVEKAKKIAYGLGYTQIFEEYTIQTKRGKFVVDVYGENENKESIAIECGNINSNKTRDWTKRLWLLLAVCDEVLWLPYFNSKIPDGLDPTNTLENLYARINELSEEKAEIENEIELLKRVLKHFKSLERTVKEFEDELNKLKYEKSHIGSLPIYELLEEFE